MNGGTDLDALRAEIRVWAALLMIAVVMLTAVAFVVAGAVEVGVVLLLADVVCLSGWYCERFDGWNRKLWRLFYKKEDGQYIGDHFPQGDER